MVQSQTDTMEDRKLPEVSMHMIDSGHRSSNLHYAEFGGALVWLQIPRDSCRAVGGPLGCLLMESCLDLSYGRLPSV